MNLELNLVKNQGVYSQVFSLLARKRVPAETDTEVLTEVCNFIRENLDIFDAAVTNKALISQLEKIDMMTIDEFSCFKFVIANSGIDLLIFGVSDVEVDSDGVPAGKIEYNVIDNNQCLTSFVKFCTKVLADDKTSDFGDVYKNIIDMYGFFSGELFTGFRNPLSTQLQVINESERLLGVAPASSTQYVNSILEYLGKNVIVITE